MEPETHPALLVGTEGFDDAGVYALDAERALIQTVDFFTPVVDDPYTFGAISAANSLSDVYAMGGRPITALVVSGTSPQISLETLARIFAGGQAKLREAGVPLLGGHTVKDPEVKYGLAVTGLAHPDRVITNAGARDGDVLYLTKPLGTGVITTALKEEACPPDILEGAVESMLRLNAAASEAMMETGVHACTDITGFGLAGHAHQMAHSSGLSLEFDLSSLPLLEGALEMAAEGHIPGGLNTNRSVYREWITGDPEDEPMSELLYDAQTSGGLLIAVPAQRASRLAEELQARGVLVAPVGRAVEGPPGRLVFRP